MRVADVIDNNDPVRGSIKSEEKQIIMQSVTVIGEFFNRDLRNTGSNLYPMPHIVGLLTSW